ncbi:Holliday junction resolvase RuvX [candidate division LCP-89 bacterium B3_LCP]|uniref:Putative pre-16S rRNA nuclease n=1 Tax=candidate division LCP-89 bacterium B3_LCP TaxID=2012998 RepID=A0A532V0F8_UNCL8|nr:MAG: Holliday junction resolvase RuvX [candidate division LCP-89 bacterium B3_LCP]
MVHQTKKANGNAQPGIIALDYGRRRVGVAGTQKGLSIAFGITTLYIESITNLIDQLNPILVERSCSEVVLGFPITLGDKPGTIKADILELASRLRSRGLTVHLVDEALTSQHATDKLKQRGKRAAKGDTDRASAALLLQEFLDGYLPPLGDVDIGE